MRHVITFVLATSIASASLAQTPADPRIEAAKLVVKE